MEKPRTPQDWKLFTSSVDDGDITWEALNRGAAALSEALDRAEHAVRAGVDAYVAYEDLIEPVAIEYDAIGAADTEAREVAVLYLMQLVSQQP